MANTDFEVLDLFLVRIPLLPIESYIQNFEANNVDNKINEAICVASMNLGKKLLNEKKPYDDEMVNSSKLKYSIRMSTRATPFGIFSAVSYGRFGQSTKISFNGDTDRRKKSRPDMAWLFQIIKELELNKNVNKFLSYTLNPSIYSVAERAFLLDRSFLRKVKPNSEIVSMKKTIVFESIEEICTNKNVSYENILTTLAEQFQAKYEQIDAYLQQLIESEFLISSLRPNLNNSSPFEFFLNELPEIVPRENLLDIQRKLADFDRLPIGCAVDLLPDITDQMDNVVKNASPIQVDTYLEPEHFILTNKIKSQIIQATKCLWTMNQFENDRLFMYKNSFLNKYGYDTEVELLELLDEDIGLGFPEYPAQRINEKAKNTLEALIINAYINNQTEINITDDMLDKFSVNDVDFPGSVELYASLLFNKESTEDDDKVELVVSSIQPSISAGSSLGRFTHLLDKQETKTYYDKLLENINKISENPMIAVISSYPVIPRHANVMINEFMHKYEIPVTVSSNDKEQIELRDILVGINNGTFYLKHKRSRRLIHLTHHHLLISDYQPPISRFLHEVSLAGQIKLSGLYHRTLLPFKPRIRYQNNIILSVASWKISPEWEGDLYSNVNSIDTFMIKFSDYREKWRLPQYVFLCDYDNKLLLDLNQLSHVKEIHKMILQNKVLVLEEMIGELRDHTISGTSGSYFHEFVFSVVSKGLDSKKTIKNESEEYSSHLERYFAPFSEWTTLKVFGVEKRKREFLTRFLYPYFESLRDKSYLKKWYFIQYRDEDGKHLRIRYEVDREYQTVVHLNLIEWIKDLRNKRLISTLKFTGYERELWRYGGKKTIDHVEDFFLFDSICTITILNSNKNNAEQELLAILSLTTMIRILTNGMIERKDVSKEYNSEYRSIKKQIEQLMKAYYIEEQIDNEVMNSIRERNQKLKPILIQKENLTQERWGKMCSSLIHMHCNRLFGIDAEKERKIVNLSRHAVISSKYFL